MLQIKGDLHTHTLYSRHAYSTIQENVAAAAAAGLEVFGSADHFSAMLFPEQDFRNFQFFSNVEVWPREWMGVTVLRACEADILTLDGGLFGQGVSVPSSIVGRAFKLDRDLYDRVTEHLDYVIASVHNADFTLDATKEQTTDMYIKALQHEKVFILGHPGRSGVAFYVDEVLSAAKELGKVIEINEHSFDAHRGREDKTYSTCRTIAERCAELGVHITVSTDAHIATSIGKVELARTMLEEIDFPQELIVNRSREAVLARLDASGVSHIE